MRWRLSITAVFIGISIFLTQWPTSWSHFLESSYGESIYPSLISLLARLPQPKNMAIMDALWVFIPLIFLVRIGWLITTNLVRRIPLVLSETLLWVVSGYLLFMLMWGLNYQRPSLYSYLNKQGFTEKLVKGHWEFALQQTLLTLEKLPTDFNFCSHSAIDFSNSRSSAFAHSAMALANLPPAPNRKISPSAFSTVYTNLGVAGVYIPFTGEPTFSANIFGLSSPFVMTHEYSHFAGYAREYDADILAYWSLWMSPDPIWQYSAWLEWWMEVAAPKEYYTAMPKKLKDGFACYVDHLRNQPRWEVRKYFWQAYEANLKNQGISEGLKSYKMGEAMALSSYQDWLYKKRNRF